MPTILGANTLSSGYNVANSLRFNYDSSDYLNKTLGTATNRKIFTISMWVKRSELYGVNSETKYLMSAGNNASTNIDEFYFRHDTLDFSGYESSTTEFQLRTNQLFRDVSSWYHIVVAYDSTQGTASNRIKMYVNGSQITSFSTETYPDQNHEPLFNSNIAHEIGRNTDARYFDGYITEVVFIDGQALDPTSFGEFDEDSPNIWKPKNVSGLTFGTNGFYLDFENASSLGADVSGNSNNFTVNNLTSVDQSTDTCTNNFATLNPLHRGTHLSDATFSEGNLKHQGTASGGNYPYSFSTLAASQGKWYAEFKVASDPSTTMIGIASGISDSFLGGTGSAKGYALYGNSGNLFTSGSGSSYGSSLSVGDILGVAMDLDNNKLYFSKNGTFHNSGDPTSGSTGTGAVSITAPASNGTGVYHFACGKAGSATTSIEANFGSPSFSISSGNSDANGYGNFEYAVPSGYYSLNSKNLAEFG